MAPDLRGDRMRTLDVMVDLDDVVFPMIDSVHHLAHEAGLHDNSRPLASWRGWEQYGCTETEFFDLWGTFARAGGYVLTPPIPGAVEAMREAHDAGHRLHLVTARGFMAYADQVRTWTPMWVERFAVPHASLSFSKRKPEVQSLLGVRFDYAFDDSPPNAYALTAAGVPTFLVDHPHNAWVDDLPRVPDLATGLRRIVMEAAR